MPTIVAVLFEEPLDHSYLAIRLDGINPEIIFTKGPAFTKIMGPYPEPYAEATYRRWQYYKVLNPPEVHLNDPRSILHAVLRLSNYGENTTKYYPENT